MSQKVDLGRRATYQDVLDAPAHLVAEIVGGDLYLGPRPAPVPSLAKSRLGAGLAHAFALERSRPSQFRPEGWWILDEPELRLGGRIMVPDLVGWRRERMPKLPDTAYFTLAPDWVCEVLSTEKHRLKLHGNCPIYAREGVRHLWLVDVRGRTLEAFEFCEGEWVRITRKVDEDTVSIAPFDATAFSLADLWS